MKKTNFTFLKTRMKQTTLLFSFLFTMLCSVNILQAQCSLACNGTTQVSLDATCSATITADMILNAQSSSCGSDFDNGGAANAFDADGDVRVTYAVVIKDSNGSVISTTAPDVVNNSHIGKTLTVEVTAIVETFNTASTNASMIDSTSNKCWGSLVVEDKIAPVVDCVAAQAAIDATTFYCYSLTTFDLTPHITQNCGIDTIILSSELITTNPCTGGTAADILKTISREYIVIDSSGNQSTTCALNFTVNRIPSVVISAVTTFQNIQCPSAFLESNSTALSCSGTYARDTDGNPDPTVTGVPNLLVTPNPDFVDIILPLDGVDDDNTLDADGNPIQAFIDDANKIALYPSPSTDCNLVSSYTDVTLPAIGCVTKIIRTWSIVEWNCDSRSIPSCVQMIEIVDNAPPTFTALADMTVTTNVNGSFTSSTHGTVSCAATLTLPSIVATDSCDMTTLQVDVKYPNGLLDNQNGGSVQLPLGDNEVVYTIYDSCLNSVSDTINVRVVDQTAPVAVCTQNTVVSLTNADATGTTLVTAQSFDAGSYDDCSLDSMFVRRMTDAETAFASTVSFTCADIGTPVTVVFRVRDADNNINDCMVTVDVQDKIAPVITCPMDMTVDCTTLFDINDLAATFGTATAFDNCSATVTEIVSANNLNQCNVGSLRRLFTATDNGGRTDTCSQLITFQNPSPFVLADITFPLDSTFMEGCSDPTATEFLPASAGLPVFAEDQCDLVGATYTDQVYPFNDLTGDACFKIVREWTVIDWCQFSGGSYMTWTHSQVIRVNNSVAPTFTANLACTDTIKVARSYDATCTSGFIELSATATDDCTETDALSHSYVVDLNNDGVADTTNPVTGGQALTGSGVGTTETASGIYPVGTHKVTFIFRDKCGNVSSCEQVFSIVNAKAPSVFCIDGLATDLMPIDSDNDGTVDGGSIEIWASDFDNKSSHTCGYRLIFSFSATDTSTAARAITYTCDSLVGPKNVDVYAHAIDSNNNIISSAFCSTTLDIQDNMSSCTNNTGGGDTGGVIAGRIVTEENETLEDVSIELEGANFNPVNTNSSGEYAFPSMGLGGDYVVQPSKVEEPLNGVSTLDLVIIQRHILGIDNLDSPFKHIAADINRDDNISAIDLIELRKMILGVVDNFNSNESWRFIDSAYSFGNGSDPLDNNFPEAYEIANLNGDMDIDFTAVKVGDVNNTASTNLDANSIENRYVETLNFNLNNTSYQAGDVVEIPFYAAQNVDILGYQFTIDFDANSLEFVEGKSGEILTNTYNYGTQMAEEGMITTSWNTVTPELISEGDVAFTLVFRAKADGNLKSDLDVNSQLTAAEAYNADQDLLDIKVNFDNEESTDQLGYVLYQNTPNPFDNSTEISFHLPKAMSAQLRIYDVSGRTISVYNDVYQAGMNMIVVDKSTLASAGILYYTLETNNFTATKRMVVIK